MKNKPGSCIPEKLISKAKNSTKIEHQERIRAFSDYVLSIAPSILGQAVKDYQAVVSDASVDDTKMFAACHMAGRSALLHMQELLRLADWLSGRADADAIPLANSDVDELLRQAKLAIRKFDEGDATL